MGFTLKPPPDSAITPELRNWFKLFSAWARDRERFEKSITSGAEFKSASNRLSLKQGITVDSTRVASTEPGVTALDLTGDLIPSADNTYNISSQSFRYKDVRSSGVAYLTGLSVSNVITGLSGAIMSSGLSISGGLTVSGGCSITGGAFIGPNGGSLRTWRFTDAIMGNSTFVVSSNGSITDFTADSGDVSFGIHGFTSLGPADFLSPTSFAAGISATSGFTYSGPVATIQNLTVNNGFTGGFGTFSDNLRVDGVAGITGALTAQGQAIFVGGVSSNGGITFNGSVQFMATAAVAGRGMTSHLFPITNLTGNIGLTGRRFANIFGGTITTTNNVVAGGSITATLGNISCGGDISLGGNFASMVDATASLGIGDPGNVAAADNRRFGSCLLSGAILTGGGGNIPAGTTISFNVNGNYWTVTGVSDVAGISWDGALQDPQAGIIEILHLANNPNFTHSSRLILLGGTTWSGATDATTMFISEGSGNWRQIFKSS